jgi:hypothetical protein
MKRSARVFTFVAVLTATVLTSQAAYAFLFIGIKRLDLAPGSANDCLTIALATMRNLGFASLKRGNDVSGLRAGAFVSVSCRPAPGGANSFWVFIASAGDDKNATLAGVNVVLSNL